MKIDEDKSLQYVYVGLDISKEEIEICVINGTGRILHTFQVPNTRSGFHKLIENLLDYDDILFGMESTGPYSGNFNQFLRNINAEVVLTNPFQVARLRDVFSKSVKTDIID
ncbi:MAG: hypothetical protein HeimC2_32700 [Candidatus Heimdallarchaeota archaeon LC_2]|nr:MAG: hypothetical protein HeimC2_32700 [Candidatus Heimdallarchaeota archaeon LC_2]